MYIDRNILYIVYIADRERVARDLVRSSDLFIKRRFERMKLLGLFDPSIYVFQMAIKE